jgi:ATP-dependent helicase/nuclease subunit B
VAANVFTIPSSAPFADTLARGLIAKTGSGPLDLAAVTIFLPTQRAARTFGDAFSRQLGGAALLPEFKALGDVDEDEFQFDAEALELTPAIRPMRRTLLLGAIITRWHKTTHGPIGTADSLALAEGLASVMDEMETQGSDLNQLDGLVSGALAAHWEKVLNFLKLLQTEWPKILEVEGRISPAARRNQALKALAEKLQNSPPKGPVIAAGSTGSIPATAELLRVIAYLPNGAIVLPGLDRELDETSWRNLDPGHPQFGQMQLLRRMNVARTDVQDWIAAPNPARERALREALRPAPTTDAWRTIADDKQEGAIAAGIKGVELVSAADPAEEAAAIALVLREALEEPRKTAALVTPDRSLARRVASELERWGVTVDDSAGRPLSQTPPGIFLCLLAEAADEAFAPVPLLALLKHPLSKMDGDAAAFRAKARVLDTVLRGPRPDPGLTGIAKAIAGARAEHDRPVLSDLEYWFARLRKSLAPLENAFAGDTSDINALLYAHLGAAADLAGDALWQADAGDAAARFVEELVDASKDLPKIDTGAYVSLFRKLASAKTVRLNRSGHPRVAILGALEARLQRFDTVVLGGLNEGTWPRAPGADPWFSRPMRSTLGLEQPEFRIGQAAHDFAMLAAGPRVVLTHAKKADGVPAIPSRWVQRLVQLTNGLGLTDSLMPRRDYLAMAQAMSDAGVPQPEKRPDPRPPVEARPNRASVTEIERWIRDPYAIYAHRILRLRVLDPLDAPIGPMERGNAVHKALERFVNEHPGPLAVAAALQLIAIGDQVFAAEGTPKAAIALWRPRFMRAATWFVEEERKRRPSIASSRTEIRGEFEIVKDFALYGVADRIDVLTDGTGAILDYKTGKPPTLSQIRVFLTPQLLLEAGMLANAAFPGLDALETSQLLYVQVSGGRKPGDIQTVDVARTPAAMEKLRALIELYRDLNTPYLPRPYVQFARAEGDFDHLARVREWSQSGWEAPEE